MTASSKNPLIGHASELKRRPDTRRRWCAAPFWKRSPPNGCKKPPPFLHPPPNCFMPTLAGMKQKLQELSDGYLSKLKAAAYADVSPRTLDYAVERRELTAFKLTLTGTRHRKVLFRRSDIDAWIERHRVGADLDSIVDEVMDDFRGGK